MAATNITASDIKLQATWYCWVHTNEEYTDAENRSVQTVTKTVRFKLTSLPKDAEIYSTRVHSVWDGALYGYATATVDGKQPNDNGIVFIDNPAPGATYVDVEFAFKPRCDNPYNHASSMSDYGTKTFSHTTTATVSEIYLRVFYRMTYSDCTAPTTVTLGQTSASPGAKLNLEWSGAAAGESNAITGYEVYRSTTEDSGYTLLTTVSSTATSGSTVVTAPTTSGETYYYKVATLGTQDGYDSGMSTAVASLTCSYETTSAPTAVRVVATNAAPGVSVTLEWSGATAGTNNPIAGYEVYRAEDPAGEYTLLTTVTTAEVTGSASVASPSEDGQTYYYKVRTLGTVEGTDSPLSTVYAALSCTYSAPSAPTNVTVNGLTSLYALPGSEITLEWSGATDGINNPILHYSIWASDTLLADNIDPETTEYTFTAPEEAGVSAVYTVVACGVYANSSESRAVNVYVYTDPVAPSSVTVSDSTPVAGSRVKLYWSGAEAGHFNEIEAYNIYRAMAANDEGALVSTVASTDTAGSCYVDVPSRAGYHYYYRVETVGAQSSSDVSTTYAEVTIKEDTSGNKANVTVKITPRKPPKKRKFVFGDYDTVDDGDWTLCEWVFTEPETATSYVDVPGRLKGPLDMTAVHTNGDPRYGNRTLTARFECSEGTRMEREGIISRMLNHLHGRKKDITLPDDETHYAVGRLSVTRDYNDMAHAGVTVSATCEPWRYNKLETTLELVADDTLRTAVLMNNGRMQVVPEITVTGYKASVEFSINDGEMQRLGAGTYLLPGVVLDTGYSKLTYTGSGNIAVRYREAIL